MTESEPKPEFSVEVELDALPRGGKTFRLKATTVECAAIARRLGVRSVENFEGDVTLKANLATIVVTGALAATLIRECVASLEDMTEIVSDSFEIEFYRDADELERVGEEAQAAAEVHEGRSFDIGELLTQQLALAMDPFPRKSETPSLADQYGRAAEASPFAAIQDKLGKSEKKQ